MAGGPLDAQRTDALAQVPRHSGLDLQVGTRGADHVTQSLKGRQRVGASRCSEKGGLIRATPKPVGSICSMPTVEKWHWNPAALAASPSGVTQGP